MPISIGNVLLDYLLDANTTNIIKDIIIFPAEDIHKKSHMVLKKCWQYKNCFEFCKKNFRILIPDKI